MSRTRLAGIAMLAFICAATYAIPDSAVPEFYIDGIILKPSDASTVREGMILNGAKPLPPESRWKSIVIRSNGSKKTFLSKWQNRHSGSIITLRREANGYIIEIKNRHGGSRQINDVEQLYLFTDAYQPPPATSPGSPVLTIISGTNVIELTEQDLSLQGGSRMIERNGWPLDWILKRSSPVSVKGVSLVCDGMTAPLAIESTMLASTFIKLNRKGHWRAVITPGDQGNKSDWIRCHNLSSIKLTPA